MKTMSIIVFVLISMNGFGQPCDTIYESPQIQAQYDNGIPALMVYLNKKLVPILSDCIKQEGKIISSMHIKLTIDSNGKVIAVDFLSLDAGKECKMNLTNELLKMPGWTAGQTDGIKVCSVVYWPVSCLNWE